MKLTHTLLLASLITLSPLAIAQDANLAQLQRDNAALKAENTALRQQLRDLQAKLITSETGRHQLVVQAEKIVAENNAFFIAIDYDTAKNTTTLSSRSTDMNITRGPGRYHWLSLETTFKGKTLSATSTPPPTKIHFQSFFSGGVYAKIKTINLIVDGHTLQLPVSNYENRYRRGGSLRNRTRKDDESFSATLTPAQLTTLAQAKTVTGELGFTRFNLTIDQLNTLKTLARQLQLID